MPKCRFNACACRHVLVIRFHSIALERWSLNFSAATLILTTYVFLLFSRGILVTTIGGGDGGARDRGDGDGKIRM